MHRSTLTILACPSCRKHYEAVVQIGSAEEIEQGFLRCACLTTVVPIIGGFALFTEPLLDDSQARPEALEQLAQRLFGSEPDFSRYVADKQARNVIEPYAAFQPFNESGRAVEPLLPHIRPALRPDGFILDAWCRTGWSGEWLAGQFPAQRVVSLWEGDSSVLGYRGFRHLLGTGRRAPNLDIVFCHLKQPLPFASDAFDLSYAHDTLHRFGGYPFANECLRVVREDGALVFPHVHLANSEPEPFFERGGTKLHGREYRAWLDRVTAGTSRRGFVFSEAALFDGPNPAQLTDDPLTPHYNGLIAILPQGAPSAAAAVTEPKLPLRSAAAAQRLIFNPMFRLDLARGTARPQPSQYDGAVAHYLLRHPAYGARLPRSPLELDELALLAIHLAAGGATEAQLLTVADDESAMRAALERLSATEMLLRAPVSAAAHYLQRVHSNQHAGESESARSSGMLAIAEDETEIVGLEDGTQLDGRGIAELAQRLRAHLARLGVVAGDCIAVAPEAHPLLWLVAIAAADAGVEVRIPGLPESGPPKLRLCQDRAPVPQGWMALGLDGSPAGLLAALEDSQGDGGLPVTGQGLIEIRSAAGVLRFPIGLLAAGCMALRGHREPQLLLLGSGGPLKDLLSTLTALVDRQRLRTA